MHHNGGLRASLTPLATKGRQMPLVLDPRIPERLMELWDEVETLFVAGLPPGYWGQDSYKSFIFRKFCETYAIQPLHGDAVFKHIEPRIEPAPLRDEKLKALREICDAWSEWQYAFDNHPRR
jgi:hypothetical protein